MTTAPAPMISVAGIRGVVGQSLRLEDFVDYAQAFLADFEPRRLVLGRDTRASGEMLRHAIIAAGIASGVEVCDLGVAPTPTVGLMARKLKAGGGIMLSASHNPPQWNALKFFSAEGSFLRADQLQRVLDRHAARDFRRAEISGLGKLTVVADPLGPHLRALLAALPVERIRRARLRVALDACNGAGLELAVSLFRALKVKFTVIHSAQEGKFERPPEPLPENLGKLRREALRAKADVGFALDPDADRLAIVDERGRAIGEERTVALAIDWVLRSGPKKPVVVNLSTTRAVDDAAARHGARVVRTKIGEAHVVGRMKELGSRIGGEGNGGVIFPRVHAGRDSATGMGLILSLLASPEGGSRRKPLSEINGAIPDYAMVKDKIDLPDLSLSRAAIGSLLKALPDFAAHNAGEPPIADETDGLKIIMRDRWLHVRASGTEPILRLFAEAPTAADARRLVEAARGLVSPLLQSNL